METKEEFLQIISAEETQALILKYRDELTKRIRRRLKNFNEDEAKKYIKDRQQCQNNKTIPDTFPIG